MRSILKISLILAFISFPLLTSAEDNSTTTRIIVTEGKVICFDLPKELALIAEKGETTVGKFIGRIDEDEETCRANL